MAKSKFEYVKQFDVDYPCLQNCWVVVRVDGKAFQKFTEVHYYMKPNDERGLHLMTKAAKQVMGDFNDIVLAYGQSDEYSFVFHKDCNVYGRRASQIASSVASLFASSFTLFWRHFFNAQELKYPPTFDTKVAVFPSEDNLRDYLKWRQADCHINNLYNTCFWKLIQERGLSPSQAEDRLKGTMLSDKNELLFKEMNTNYNTLPELYRKGTVIIRPKDQENSVTNSTNSLRMNNSTNSRADKRFSTIVLYTDIISNKFWEDYPYILNSTVVK